MSLIHRVTRKLRRHGDPEPVNVTIAKARAASEAMARPVRHNPDQPDADLNTLAAGGSTP